MIRKIPSQGGEEGNRGIRGPKSGQEAHRSQQQEVGKEGRPRDQAGTPREGQKLEDSPARRGQEEQAMGAGPVGSRHSSVEELLEDSRDEEEVQFIG